MAATATTVLSFVAMSIRRWLALVALCALPVLFTGSCAGSECERNSDCAYAQCIQGECVAQCKLDLDCPLGQVCNREVGRCDPPDGGVDVGIGGSGGNVDASLGGAGGVSSGGTGGGVAGSGGTPSGGTGGIGSGGIGGATGGGGSGGTTSGNKVELDLCGTDAECKSGLVCRAYGKSLAKRCTRPCSQVGAAGQCFAGTRCEDINGDKYCIAPDFGKGCTTGPDCNYACLVGPKYCTSTCGSGADCPNGWGCMLVSGTKVCVKAAEVCDGGANPKCVVQAACDVSSKMIVGGCTLACNSAADCPQRALPLPQWTCDGLCRRPSDIFGPLEGGTAPSEWHCDGNLNPVNVCGDGQHINFTAFTIPPPPSVNCSSPVTIDGVAGDACVDSCRYAGGCPLGFQCVAVGNVNGNRIGLCLPGLGSGQVGAACAKDADCFFGYCNRNKGTCSRDCSSDGLCPTGFNCVAGGGPTVEGLPFRRCE